MLCEVNKNLMVEITTFHLIIKLMTKTIIEQLKTITETIEDLIEKETTTWYPDRELPGSSLTDLEEVYELLENIVNYEPTDQQMLSSFGTKWHDRL